ncbi:MAG: 4Fe-4S cluster-binding domain-containing protein [Candidatus Altiarchaeales archaeon]|nr:4Fe-4S cluster-binding domain-containing protein [Candidatus Altiarchaeales archaeon]MBD3416217.1 4Fe-4S cluster-binding domain-containing protein [Candidatus Altiarchaeales archaeon]
MSAGDEGVQRALPRYLEVLDGRRKARFLECDSLEEKAEAASAILGLCNLCERRCGSNRAAGERGYCGVLEPRISSEFIHLGEEPEIVPSHTIFLTGCTFKCVFCQNWDISQSPGGGTVVHPGRMADIISSSQGVNVNWVGGDPAPSLPYVLEVLSKVGRSIPQIWNSNMYLSEESMGLLDGVVDVYLTDFKYGNDDCAMELSDAPRYWSVTTGNHILARDQAELVIRHLVMPGHLECCTKPVLHWIGEHLGDTVRVNVMAQYRPEYLASRHPQICRPLKREEHELAVECALDEGLNLCRR